MDRKIYLTTKIITWVIMIVSAVLVIAMMSQSSDMKKVTEETLNSPLISYSFYLCYISLALSIIVALIFPIINTIANPKQLVRALILIAGFVLIGVVAYFMETLGGSALSMKELNRLNVTESTSTWVGVGIYYTYIIGIVAILTLVFSAVKNTLKK